MRYRAAWRMVAIPCLAVACAKAPISLTPQESSVASTLTGVWSVHLSLSTTAFGPQILDGRSTTDGQIALLCNTSIRTRDASVGTVTNYGSYNIDFSGLGFDSPENGKP